MSTANQTTPKQQGANEPRSLENRIADALTAPDITADAVADLIAETEDAIVAAGAAVEAERVKAYDPALSPDPRAAREAMVAAGV